MLVSPHVLISRVGFCPQPTAAKVFQTATIPTWSPAHYHLQHLRHRHLHLHLRLHLRLHFRHCWHLRCYLAIFKIFAIPIKVFQTAPIPTWSLIPTFLLIFIIIFIAIFYRFKMEVEEDDEGGEGRSQLIWRSLRSFETRGAMFCQHQVARLSLFNAPEDRMYNVQQTKQTHHAIHLHCRLQCKPQQ